MIFGIYVVLVKILDGIEYQHHTSLNMRIVANHVTLPFLALLKSIFQMEPSNLRGTRDISSGFAKFQFVYFLHNFFYVFAN